jgi:MOSC domain-containing protein YiiM
MNTPILISVQVGLPQRFEDNNTGVRGEQAWTSGIKKKPVSGRIRVTKIQLEGDGQADLKHHGGPDKAILAYGESHYPTWREELVQPDFPYGAFGENLTIQGLTEQTVCIGDTYKIGDVVVQVSQPRMPCWKLSRLWNSEDLDNRVKQTGKTGWYLRVLQEGYVEANLVVELVARPFPEWTIARANDLLAKRNRESSDLAELARIPLLAGDLRSMLESKLS